jgi:2-C-methyl-D-erythritol 4-phosphate cytidylyltransferase
MERLSKKGRPAVSAIIAAAGSAARMNGLDKQMLHIEGVPVVVHSILAFSGIARVAEIVVACREEDIPEYYAMVQAFGLEKVRQIVAGGVTRQDSVFRAVAACDPEAEYFAVHDGARPLVRAESIEACIDAAILHGAAAAAVPVKDTIKVCDRDGFVVSTPNRDTLFAVQTPQIFAAERYRAAMQQAIGRGASYTDDCQLMERAGHPVFMSQGSYDNIKITTPEDIPHAQAILAFRTGGLDR